MSNEVKQVVVDQVWWVTMCVETGSGNSIL